MYSNEVHSDMQLIERLMTGEHMSEFQGAPQEMPGEPEAVSEQAGAKAEDLCAH